MQLRVLCALCVFALAVIEPGQSHPTGASSKSCSNLKPGHHGAEAQKSNSPYSLTAERSPYDDGTIKVTVKGKNGEQFKGYMIQAQNIDGTGIITGTFGEDVVSKAMDCSGTKVCLNSSMTLKRTVQ